MWTLPQFCYLSILWWAENKPEYSSARGGYCQSCNHWSWMMTTWSMSPHPPQHESSTKSRSGFETSSCPELPSSWSTPRGGFKKECSPTFRIMQCSCRATLQPWIHQEMEIFGNSAGRAMVEDTITIISNTGWMQSCWAGCWGCPSKTAQWHSCTSVQMPLCNAAAERPPPLLLLVRDPGSHSSATIAILQSKKNPRLSQVRLCSGLPLPDGAVNAPMKDHRNSWREGKETSNTSPANKSPAPHQWCWKVSWNMAKAG